MTSRWWPEWAHVPSDATYPQQAKAFFLAVLGDIRSAADLAGSQDVLDGVRSASREVRTAGGPEWGYHHDLAVAGDELIHALHVAVALLLDEVEEAADQARVAAESYQRHDADVADQFRRTTGSAVRG